MTGHPGIADAWETSFFHNRIPMTDTAGFHFNADFGLPGFRDFFVYKLKFSAGRSDLYCFH